MNMLFLIGAIYFMAAGNGGIALLLLLAAMCYKE